MKVRVLSYNIHKGFDTFGANFTLHEIKKAIQETDADVVFLQEVVGENFHHQSRLKDWPRQPQFEFLADSVWPHYSYGKNAVYDQRHHGNAVLSKFPIVRQENINISTNKREQRGLLHCELDIPELNHFHLHVFNVHLDLFQNGRKKQMKKIVERASEFVPKGSPFIVAGDFNDWSQNLTAEFTADINVKESHYHLHQTYAKSFPSHFPFLSLDRIYFRNLEINSAETLGQDSWARLSDHIPLLVEFELKIEKGLKK